MGYDTINSSTFLHATIKGEISNARVLLLETASALGGTVLAPNV